MANTNVLAIEAAREALRDDEFYKFSLQKNTEAKQHIYKTLDGLGLSYIPSHTNFVFFKTGRPIQRHDQCHGAGKCDHRKTFSANDELGAHKHRNHGRDESVWLCPGKSNDLECEKDDLTTCCT